MPSSTSSSPLHIFSAQSPQVLKRLPPELILKILFESAAERHSAECQPTREDCKGLAHCPRQHHPDPVFASVCKDWRSVVLSRPKAWSTIRAYVHPLYKQNVNPQELIVLNRRDVRLCVKFSDPEPIHLSIGCCHTERRLPSITAVGIPFSLSPDSIERIESLSIDADNARLVSMCSNLRLPRLKRIQLLSGHKDRFPVHRGWIEKALWWEAPLLQEVRFHIAVERDFRLPSALQTIRLLDFNGMSVFDETYLELFFHLASSCEELLIKVGRLAITWGFHDGSLFVLGQLPTTIIHQNLKKLHLDHQVTNIEPLPPTFLDRVVFPNLEELIIHYPEVGRPQDVIWLTTPNKLPNLTSLQLTLASVNASSLRTIIGVLPNLNKLTFDEPHYWGSSRWEWENATRFDDPFLGVLDNAGAMLEVVKVFDNVFVTSGRLLQFSESLHSLMPCLDC